jgi:thiosulfate/3-mercaptopyruvate sulfurtransferase
MLLTPIVLAVLAALPDPAQAREVLVTTDWVYENLKSPGVRLVEVSVDPGVYEQGHVQGAVGFKWHSDLCDPVGRNVVSREKFAELCQRSGIANDTTVVLYGDNNNWFACWGFWIFTMYGHADVRLMDGGRKKWELEKRPLDTSVPSYPSTSYQVAAADLGLRARLVDVLQALDKQDAVLVDVRSADEHSGKVIAPPGVQELAIRAGCIPGSKNVPWAKTVKDDGTFRPVEELRKLYADAGVDGSAPIITYCRIGERSSHSWFVLQEILGYDVRNYDGSWTEYGNAVGVPIENKTGTVWTGK